MKRLEIVLIGHSQALGELAIELEAHGHLTHHLPDAHALEHSQVYGASLIIDDGTLALTSMRLAAFKTDAQLGLRIGMIPDVQGALPRLELLCWYGSTVAQKLIARRILPAEPSGNGRMLRDSAITTLVDDVALLVSRLSRDAGFFAQVERVEPPQSEWQEGLLTLDRLAFEHRYN